MAARKGRPPTGPSSAGGAVPEEVRAFQHGLFPILVEGDTDAFRRYLGRWEEIIGDTAALGELPDDEQRALMSRLLRRPQLYNLPPWPEELAESSTSAELPGWPTSPPLPPTPARQNQVVPTPREQLADLGTPASLTLAVPDEEDAPPSAGSEMSEPSLPPADCGESALGAEEAGTISYQLDMITGELVPVAVSAPRLAESPSAYEPARSQSRRRRRRLPPNMIQLNLWPENSPGPP